MYIRDDLDATSGSDSPRGNMSVCLRTEESMERIRYVR